MKTNWITKKLEDVCEILDNKRKPISDKVRQNMKGDIPYYGANGQVGWINDYLLDDKLILLAEDGGNYLDPFKPNAYIIEGKAWVNNHAHVIKNKSEIIDFNWLFYVLAWSDIRSYVSGTTRLKLNQTRMREIPIPLPPLQEQKQIVSKIKECFTLLDKSEEKLKQAEDKLNKVMDSALERLIPDTLPEEDDRWEIKSLGDIFQVYTGKTPKTKEKLYYTNQDIPFVGPSDLPDSEIIITKANKYIDKYAVETGVVRLLPKDTVLLCCIGATIGKVGIAEVELTTNQQINSFIPNPKFDMKYLYFYLRKIRSLITTESSSTTMPILNKSKTENLPFIYPQDISRQKAISKKLEKLKTYSDESIRRLQGQKAFIKSLRQSILKKAFEGKLI